MPTQAECILSFVIAAQQELGRNKWWDLQHSYQKYYAKKLLSGEIGQYEIVESYGIRRNINISDNGSAAHTAPFEGGLVFNQTDSLATYAVPFKHVRADWEYDTRLEAMNSGEAQLVDYVKLQRARAYGSLAKLIESDLWHSIPSAADTMSPYGIPYHVVKWTAAAAAPDTVSFQGTNPVASDMATDLGAWCGLNTAAAPYLGFANNLAARYSNVSRDDLIEKMLTCFELGDFESPIEIPNYDVGSDNWSIFTNQATRAQLRKKMEDRNQNLGNDLSYDNGMVYMHRRPILWVPALTADAGDPIYGIHWPSFHPIILKNNGLREEPPAAVGPTQPEVFVCLLFLTWNMVCNDRRRQFVLSKTSKTNTLV